MADKTSTQKWSHEWIQPSFGPTLSHKTKTTTKKRHFSGDTNQTNGDKSVDQLTADSVVTTNSKELAISSIKCKQLSQWFVSQFTSHSSESKFLLLNGPTGTGKTTSLKVLAKEMDVEVIEYKTYSQYYETLVDDHLQERQQNMLILQNQIQNFRSFIEVSVRYGRSRLSLESTDSQMGSPVGSTQSKANQTSNGVKNRLILVEEFPNVFYGKPEAFHKELRFLSRNFATRLVPIVFIISEKINGNSDEYKLLPKALQIELNMKTISFKPITDTSLNKLLKRLTDDKLSKSEIQKLIDSSSGDVRNAINNLQLVYRHSNDKKCDKKSKKVRKSDQIESICEHILRDPSLTITHAIGKILYAKREDPQNRATNSSHKLSAESEYELAPHFRRTPLLDSPQSIGEKIVVSSDVLNAWLHQNYIDFCDSLESAQNCMQWLCHSDALFSGEHHFNYKSTFESYQSSLAIQGLMYSLPASNQQSPDAEPLKRKFKPFDRPQSLVVNRLADSLKRQIIESVNQNNPFSSVKSVALDLMPFLSLMPKHIQSRDDSFKYILDKIVKYEDNCQFNERDLCVAFSKSAVNQTPNHLNINSDTNHTNDNSIEDNEDYTIEDSDCD